jgi:hypothetical protein
MGGMRVSSYPGIFLAHPLGAQTNWAVSREPCTPIVELVAGRVHCSSMSVGSKPNEFLHPTLWSDA